MTAARISRRRLLAGTIAATGAAVIGPSQTIQAGIEKSADGLELLPAWDPHVHLSGCTGTVRERVATLLKYADRVRVERMVICMGRSWSPHPTPDDFRRQNDDVLEAIACAPDRVMGFVYLNPQHQKESLAEIERCVAQGPMVGIKLWIAMVCSRPELDPIARRAGELGVPIMQHAYWRTLGNMPDESDPSSVAELAARHPGTNFICAHTGNDWERGIRVIRSAKNVWADISGCDPTAGMVEMAVRELGPSRVLYASDAGGRTFASQLAKVYSAGLPRDVLQRVLRDNLRNLLAPTLKAKGIKA